MTLVKYLFKIIHKLFFLYNFFFCYSHLVLPKNINLLHILKFCLLNQRRLIEFLCPLVNINKGRMNIHTAVCFLLNGHDVTKVIFYMEYSWLEFS